MPTLIVGNPKLATEVILVGKRSMDLMCEGEACKQILLKMAFKT